MVFFYNLACRCFPDKQKSPSNSRREWILSFPLYAGRTVRKAKGFVSGLEEIATRLEKRRVSYRFLSLAFGESHTVDLIYRVTWNLDDDALYYWINFWMSVPTDSLIVIDHHSVIVMFDCCYEDLRFQGDMNGAIIPYFISLHFSICMNFSSAAKKRHNFVAMGLGFWLSLLDRNGKSISLDSKPHRENRDVVIGNGISPDWWILKKISWLKCISQQRFMSRKSITIVYRQFLFPKVTKLRPWVNHISCLLATAVLSGNLITGHWNYITL